MHVRTQRIIRSLAFLVLTFLFGVGVSYSWRHYGPIIVTSVTRACGPASSYTRYELLGSSPVVIGCYKFWSPDEVTQALNSSLYGSEIMDRKHSFDTEGKLVTEIIVERDSRYFRIKIGENTFCSTEGPTLRHLDWADR